SRVVDSFHTVSNFSAERISHHFPSMSGRLKVIHNAVTELFFSDDCEGDLRRLSQRGVVGREYLLLPGGLWYRKNAELVLRAWPLLRQIHPELCLVITSHNDPKYVALSGGEERGVILTGYVPDEELRALYRNASAVWFPSLYEGFGLPVLEAMACG